jgi:hypothetical protein
MDEYPPKGEKRQAGLPAVMALSPMARKKASLSLPKCEQLKSWWNFCTQNVKRTLA